MLALYLVTDRGVAAGRSLRELVHAAVRGGVSIVQLREKQLGGRAFAEEARGLLEVLRPLGVPLIINDRVDVALAVGAEGVHLGQSDLSAADARRLLGDEAILGLTVESDAEAAAVDATLVDYVGASVFPTGTKTDVAGVFGLEGMRRLCASLPIPVVAIGGINASNAGSVLATGAAGVAVVSAILGAPDPRAAAEAFRPPVHS